MRRQLPSVPASAPAGRSRHTVRLPLVASALILAVAIVPTVLPAPAHAGQWKGQIVTENGVRHMKNPAAAMEAPVTIQLKELWRLGGETDDDNEFFGVITRINTDEAGNVYLLDFQLHEIKVFSPDGRFLRKMGREGEGPGEFRMPLDMLMLPDKSIGVMQIVPGKIVRMTREGKPLDDYPLPASEGVRVLLNGDVASGHIVVAFVKTTVAENKMTQTRYLAAIDPQGKEIARYHSDDRTLDFANAVLDEDVWDSFETRWLVAPDDRVFAQTSPGAYRIHVWTAGGSLDRIIERDVQPIKRTPAERDSLEKLFAASTRGQGIPFTFKIRENHRALDRLYVREDGSIWVATPGGSRNAPGNAISRFDLFDREGRFVQEVTLLGEGDPRRDGLFFDKDRLYVVKGLIEAAMAMQGRGAEEEEETEEEPEPVEVICYQLSTDKLALK